jgi:hypothetical protein
VGGIEMSRPHGFESVDEAVASTTEGLKVMMSHGVSPRFNQWRREPKSNLVKEYSQPAIPTEFYLKLMRNRYELWKKYSLPLPSKGSLIPSRIFMGAEHGTYDDFPLLMEAPWYQDPKLRTPEEIVSRGLLGKPHPVNRYIHRPSDLA